MSISINNLPSEVFQDILSYLSLHELSKASRVCKFWVAEANDPHLWKRLYVTQFPNDDMKSIKFENVKEAFKSRVQSEKDKKNEVGVELQDHQPSDEIYYDYWASGSADYD